MKLAVHCPLSLLVCTPGWTVALSAGAHADADGAAMASEIRAAAQSGAYFFMVILLPRMNEGVSSRGDARDVGYSSIAQARRRRFEQLTALPDPRPGILARAQPAEEVAHRPARGVGLRVERLAPRD